MTVSRILVQDPEHVQLAEPSSAACTRCGRGPEACTFCERIAQRDREAICDCGLYDFGAHLLDCESRAGFRYVVADSHEEAALPR